MSFLHSYLLILRSTTTVFRAHSIVKLDRVLIVLIIHVPMQVSCWNRMFLVKIVYAV